MPFQRHNSRPHGKKWSLFSRIERRMFPEATDHPARFYVWNVNSVRTHKLKQRGWYKETGGTMLQFSSYHTSIPPVTYFPSYDRPWMQPAVAAPVPPRLLDDDAVVVAIDNSGSTSGSSTYWRSVKTIVDSLDGHGNVHYMFWNSVPSFTHKDRVDREISQQNGSGGTMPQSMITLLQKSGFQGTIYVITDGQVYHSDVAACDAMLAGKPFKKANIYLVESWGNDALNASVACPFMRNTEFYLEIQKYSGGYRGEPVSEIIQGTSAGEIDLSRIQTIAEFDAEYDALHANIVGNTLGRGNPKLHNELLALRSRLHASLTRSPSTVDEMTHVADALRAGEYTSAETLVKDAVARYLCDTSGGVDEITQKIEVLLRLCQSNGSYDLGLLSKTSLLSRAAVVVEGAPEQAPPPDQETFGFECPIMMADSGDLPVILVVRPPEPLFKHLDKATLDAIAANPLTLLRYPELVGALKAHMDCHVGTGFAAAYEGDESPFTRRPIFKHGGLFFGNSPGCVQATKWTLAHLTTGGKLLGNASLWHLLIWYLVDQWSPELNRINSDHLRYIAYDGPPCKIGLSGLQNAILIDAPLAVSLWYSVKTAEWYAEDATRDRMRELWPHATPLLAALDVLEVAYDSAYTHERIALLRAFSILMKSKESVANRSGTRQCVRAQFQNQLPCGIFLDGPRRAEDPPPTSLPDFLQPLTLQQAWGLVNLVAANTQKKASAVPLPKAFVGEVCEPTTFWSEQENTLANHTGGTPICPATLRPYLAPGGVGWEVLAETKYGPLDRQISAYNLYIRYVMTKKAFPEDEPDAFAVYCLNSVRHAEKYVSYKVDTLPATFKEICAGIFAEYTEAYRARWGTRPDPSTVAQVMNQSMPRVTRARLET